jgi:hypothetical protein
MTLLVRSRTALAAALVLACSAGCAATTARPLDNHLVLVGTVRSIDSSADTLRPWIVTVSVEKVLMGEYSGRTLQFPVHSPAMSGLETGRTYTVKATQKGTAYIVDESQWRK